MVKSVFYRLLVLVVGLCCFSGVLAAREVEVEAQVLGHTAAIGAPLRVTVTVTGPIDMQVDASTFTYDDQSVNVEHLGDSTQTSMSIINGSRKDDSKRISTYRFMIPAEDEGLHVLAEVSVVVDGVEQRSKPSTYQIKAGKADANFRLEATVEGPNPLYPGQRATLIYRIYFKDDIELTVESLPLFDVPNFRHIGDKQFKSTLVQGFHVQEISQEVEAVDPGGYDIAESVIEGYAYTQDFMGRRGYREPKLRATAPPLQIVVSEFPEEGMPPSFSGAVGQYVIDVERIGSGKVRVGDKVTIRVLIAGPQLHTVSLPPLRKQPGFAEGFRMSDLPPVKKEVSGRAVFEVELRPLSDSVDAIPSIAFAFYDPIQGQYRVVNSEPVPIEVVAVDIPEIVVPDTSAETSERTVSGPEINETTGADDPWSGYEATPPIEIAGCYPLDRSDFHAGWWRTSSALWIIIVGAGFLYALQVWRQRGAKQTKQVGVASAELFEQARAAEATPDVVLPLIAKALLARVAEKGHMEEVASSPDALPAAGPAGEVRALLMRLEEERFAGGDPDPAILHDMLTRAEELFDRL